jgi:hypothetical protein
VIHLFDSNELFVLFRTLIHLKIEGLISLIQGFDARQSLNFIIGVILRRLHFVCEEQVIMSIVAVVFGDAEHNNFNKCANPIIMFSATYFL